MSPFTALICIFAATTGLAEEGSSAPLRHEPFGLGWQPASYFQPSTVQDTEPDEDSRQPTPPPTTTATWRSSSFSRRPVTRLASIPKMFGDFGGNPALLRISQFNNNPLGTNLNFTTSLPSAGVGQRLKALENNNAVPGDRFYFLYRHLHNSLDSTPFFLTPGMNSNHTDSYTFGYERSFLDGLTSVQFVMPFLGTPTLRSTGPFFPDNSVSGGNVGNFGVIFKGLLYENGNFAFSGGMSLNTPTGSDVNGQAFGTAFQIQNEAFQLAPFAAFVWTPATPWLSDFYIQGGVQYDMVAGGNTLSAFNPDPLTGFNGPMMEIVDSNLLFSDLVFGAFLYENPSAPILSAVAGQVELHHSWSTDPHVATGMTGRTRFSYGSATGRFDALNITGGLRFMLFGNTVLSVGAVAPLHGPLFDAEIQAVTSILL
jgi:hypothetical protein